MKFEDETMEDYLNYLRNEVELDKEKMLHMSDEDKLKCSAIGTGMLSEAINEKTHVALSPEFMYEMQKMNLSGERISKYIDAFSENDIDTLDSLTKYLRGQLNEDDASTIGNIVENVEQEINPNGSFGDVLQTIEDMKDRLNSVE